MQLLLRLQHYRGAQKGHYIYYARVTA